MFARIGALLHRILQRISSPDTRRAEDSLLTIETASSQPLRTLQPVTSTLIAERVNTITWNIRHQVEVDRQRTEAQVELEQSKINQDNLMSEVERLLKAVRPAGMTDLIWTDLSRRDKVERTICFDKSGEVPQSSGKTEHRDAFEHVVHTF
jgi:hypothetical protein